ncbi:MAG: UvrD-helicase domain-containing protein [Oligoflexia bacterium]|nr:UvrD-helicase domain-containing protein [Oligoflexia bacterium]
MQDNLTSVKTTSASIEQKNAIEHFGGVLLEAGAGSGKTYVIIEHVVYRIGIFLEENFNLYNNKRNDFILSLRIFLSEIVVATFTRKAAAELSIRLKKRIEKLASDSNNSSEMWLCVLEVLSCLNVSTIHSFCLSLIKNGTFLNLDPSSKVISEMQEKKRIEVLLKKWINLHNNNNNSASVKINELLIENLRLHFPSIVESFYKIFNDPNIRKMWTTMDVDKIYNTSLNGYIDEIKKHSPFKSAFESKIDLINDYSQFKKYKWFQFLLQFEQIKDSKTFNDILKLFINLTRLPPKPSDHLSVFEISKSWEGLKALKDFIKKKDNLHAFELYYSQWSTFKDWAQTIKDIVLYLEKNHLNSNGMTFSDLEYYVLLGLEDSAIQKRVSKLIKYFIIDEFQDVSNAQFALIEKVIDSQFDRLFGVGDIKQAIYGFRGGELEVFLKCQQKVAKVLSLQDNYRSTKDIVSFNNEFFSYIFTKGPKFSGEDDSIMKITKQSSKHAQLCIDCQASSLSGIIKSHVVFPNTTITTSTAGLKSKLKNKDVEILEAKAIVANIKNSNENNITVLYKNLNPVKYLLSLLLEEDISFQAQIKIPYKDDPIVSIFSLLIDYYLDYSQNKNKECFSVLALIINSSLDLNLNTTFFNNLVQIIDDFCHSLTIFGVFVSFQRFFFSLGISTSNYANNLQFIQEICHHCKDQVDLVWLNLKKYSDSKYSIEYKYISTITTDPTTKTTKVTIMSVHAAKGLEYSNVILGGIYTNGYERRESGYFGKIPGSFKWCGNQNEIETLKSPYYLLEEIITSNRNFSESKRLFYVAMTRAKHQLTWISLPMELFDYKIHGNSWIKGLYHFENDSLYQNTIIKKEVPIQYDYSSQIKSVKSVQSVRSNTTINETPGLFKKINFDYLGTTKVATLSEISVTNFSIIAECSKKFYFNNICKFTDEDLLLLNSGNPHNIKQNNEIEINEDEDENEILSSKKRGSELHFLISNIINKLDYIKNLPSFDFYLSSLKEKQTKEKQTDVLKWIYPIILDLSNNYQLVSEKIIKFNFFGYMLSGIPDVVAIPLNQLKNTSQPLMIIDFKSGQRDESKEQSYWTQLFTYAYAYKNTNADSSTYADSDAFINFKFMLVYLDEEIIISRNESYQFVCDFLYGFWKKITLIESFLNDNNKSSCERCEYKEIC